MAMIGGSILWLFFAGRDMGTAAEQLLNGMMSSQLLLAIPMFILAAEFMNAGSIMDRLLRFCNAIVGRFRGGLAQVNVVLSIFFAGISGSSTADAASQGKIFIEAQVKEGYDLSFSVAITAVSAVLAVIIPPSILMIVWGGTLTVSIGALFLAGIVPGFLLGLVQMATVHAYAKLRIAAIPPVALPRIYMDLGDKERPQIDKSARWFEQLLTDLGIPHEWHLYPGYHEEAYWEAHLEEYMRWYAEQWNDPE